MRILNVSCKLFVFLLVLFAVSSNADHGDPGPCVDRGQFCQQMQKFCHDKKYSKLINAECKATCRLC